MAIILNDSYQLISTIGLNYGEIRTYAKVNSQDNLNNYTSYNLLMTYYLRQWIETSSWSANLDGTLASGGFTHFNAGETTIIETTRTITHNNDGSSPVKNISTTWNASFGGSGSTNVDIQMPKIDRLATITSYPESITDEDTTITFSYSNPAGFKIKPYLMVTQGSSFIYIDFDNYITDNPFSWNWLANNDDKNALYEVTKNSPNATISLRLRTYDDNDEVVGITAVSIPLTIVNADPFVELEVEEQNEKVKNIYGDEQVAVNFVSQLKATASFLGSKGATLKRISIAGINGDTSPFEAIINVATDPQSSIFGVVATVEDSRSLTDGAEKIYQLADYEQININSFHFERSEPTSDEIVLTADITYYQETYNKVDNRPVIQYRVGKDGTLRTLSENDYSIDEENNKIRINNFILEDKLVYTQSERFYLYVSDLFTDDAENEIVTKGIPTFQAGETHFQVNGDLLFADEDGNNPRNVKDLVVDSLEDDSTEKSPSVNAVNNALANMLSKSPITPTADENGWWTYDLGFCRMHYKYNVYTYNYSGNGWGFIDFYGTDALLPTTIESFDSTRMIFQGIATCNDSAITQSVVLGHGYDHFSVSWSNKYGGAVDNATTHMHILLIDFS